MSLHSSVMGYNDSEGGVKNIASLVYDKLVSRYHNNFYINYMQGDDKAFFMIRGQLVFEDIPLLLVVKYTLEFSADKFEVYARFVIDSNSDFDYERSFVKNYEVPIGFSWYN